MEFLSRTQFAESPEMKITYKHLIVVMIISLPLVFFLIDWRGERSQEKSALNVISRDYSAPSSIDPVDKSTNSALAPLNKLADASTAEEMIQTSRDYRVVYEALVRSGSPKARFYAKEILGRCFSIKKLGLREVAVVTSQQDSARLLQQERCESFTSDELSFDSLRQVAVDPRFSVGLSEINEKWSKAGVDQARQKEVFEEVLQANDPLLLQYVGSGLLSQHRESIRLGDMEFNGDAALDSMRLAWIAAVCEGTGTDCGAGDVYVVDACASLNLCEESRRLAMRALVAQKHGATQQATFDTAHALFVKAIQSRNVQLFFPEAKP